MGPTLHPGLWGPHVTLRGGCPQLPAAGCLFPVHTFVYFTTVYIFIGNFYPGFSRSRTPILYAQFLRARPPCIYVTLDPQLSPTLGHLWPWP